MWTTAGARKGVANMFNSGDALERQRKQENERNWYLVEKFFHALADYEVTVFESENGRGPVIEVHDPETGKKVSVALTRTTNG